ncbi:IS66 family transposase [Desulfotalea psychrophila]|uniref:IS66 family transposase n=1 Tax=Desulfotalea psychrophila TaxID=84980 RepID=UPI002240FE00|nr:transposase [Desulfotalea psychrophila]
MRDLSRLEKEFAHDGLSGQELIAARNEKSKVLLQKFHDWLFKKEDQVLPKGLLDRAIGYALSQWHRLEQFIDCAAATPDNNLAENAIRPFVIGRKNWLFAGTAEGARASATIYSLIESAKVCKLEPYAYLRYLFEKLPFAENEEECRQLLPSNLSQEELEYTGRWSVI